MAHEEVTVDVYTCDNCGRERIYMHGDWSGTAIILDVNEQNEGQRLKHAEDIFACSRRCISGAVKKMLDKEDAQ